MGAWGAGIFEDDTTRDFVYELEEAKDFVKFLQKTFKKVNKSDFVEYDESCGAIVSAVLVDAILNGTLYDFEAFQAIVEAHRTWDVSPLKKQAVDAIQKILQGPEQSELYSLWEENEELFPVWKKNLEEIIMRLEK